MAVVSAWELVSQARKHIETLTVEELARELKRDDVLLVDLREQKERDLHGVIPGAVHAPRGMLEFWADPSSEVYRPEFRADRRILLYCRIGGRSVLAADTLQRMGYSNVAQLDGGFAAWEAAGWQVAPAQTSPEAPAI